MTSVFVYLSRLWGPRGLGGTVPSLCLRIQSMSQREVYRAAWKLGKTTQNSQDSTGGSFPSLNHKSDETALQNERKADSGRPEAASLLGIRLLGSQPLSVATELPLFPLFQMPA